MPLFKTIRPNKFTTIHVWKVIASFEDLSKGIDLSERSKDRLDGMKSDIHRRGFLSIRHLLNIAGYNDHDLFYTENGKPHLRDGNHISITHSYDYSAIAISSKKIGIDIEKNREKIKIIQDKFVNFERGFIDKNDDLVKQLTVIWGAKESLYKIYPKGGLTFKQDIDIASFSISDGCTTGWIKVPGWDEDYDIGFDQLDGYTLVYALEQL